MDDLFFNLLGMGEIGNDRNRVGSGRTGVTAKQFPGTKIKRSAEEYEKLRADIKKWQVYMDEVDKKTKDIIQFIKRCPDTSGAEYKRTENKLDSLRETILFKYVKTKSNSDYIADFDEHMRSELMPYIGDYFDLLGEFPPWVEEGRAALPANLSDQKSCAACLKQCEYSTLFAEKYPEAYVKLFPKRRFSRVYLPRFYKLLTRGRKRSKEKSPDR